MGNHGVPWLYHGTPWLNHGNFLVGWTIPSTLVVVTTPAGAVANLRSIVMSASVCVCLCVCPRIYLRNHTRDLYQFFILVAYGRGSVFLRRWKWKGQFSGLSAPFKSIGNLRCGVRCKGDHSIANNVKLQKGSFSMPGKRK